MYKRSRVNVKVLAQPLRLQGTLHTLPLFYLLARVRTRVKITRQEEIHLYSNFYS